MKPYLEISAILLSRIHCPAKENPDDPLSLPHLKWMLSEINNDAMSNTKSSRWLGYVYAALESLNIVETLEREQIPERFSELERSGHHACNFVCEGYLNTDILSFNNNTDTKTPEHILRIKSILETITNNTMSDQESNFLLGYAQGIMVENGLLNVNEERNRTREIFKGD